MIYFWESKVWFVLFSNTLICRFTSFNWHWHLFVDIAKWHHVLSAPRINFFGFWKCNIDCPWECQHISGHFILSNFIIVIQMMTFQSDSKIRKHYENQDFHNMISSCRSINCELLACPFLQWRTPSWYDEQTSCKKWVRRESEVRFTKRSTNVV